MDTPAFPDQNTGQTSFDQRLEELRLTFEATQHPLDLWSAYSFVRTGRGWPIPEWILREFDAIYDRLWNACGLESFDRTDSAPPTDQDWKRVVAEVFGFTSAANAKGGPSNPIRVGRIHKYWRDIDLAKRVRILMDGDGQNQTDAIYLTAKKDGVSEPTVRRAWERFASVARAENIDTQRYVMNYDDEIEALLESGSVEGKGDDR